MFYVHPYLGGKIPIFDEHIFQRGCFNHQPGIVPICSSFSWGIDTSTYIYHLQMGVSGVNGEWIRVVIQMVFPAGSSSQLR